MAPQSWKEITSEAESSVCFKYSKAGKHPCLPASPHINETSTLFGDTIDLI